MSNLPATTSTGLPASVEDMTEEAKALLRRLSGAQEDQTENLLPKLRVNYEAEWVDDNNTDAEPITLPRGSFKLAVNVDDKWVTVYAKKANFRPFMNLHRYQVYDSKTNNYTLTSVFFRQWGEMVQDNQGHEFAAKAYKRKMVAGYPQYSEFLKCVRVMYGTVTLPDGKDMHGNPVDITDVPCQFMTKGSSFMPIADSLKELEKKGVEMYNCIMECKTKRERNDGTVYFVIVPKWIDQKVPLTNDDLQLYQEFEKTRVAENDIVLKDYKKLSGALNEAALLKTVSGEALEVDFEDELNDGVEGM